MRRVAIKARELRADRRLLLTVCALLITPLTKDVLALGQQGSSSADTPVLGVATDVVQVDIVVTDKRGLRVSDLTRDDFIVREDGRVQDITHCVFVPTRDPDRALPTHTKIGSASAGLSPRHVVVLVDDLSLSHESVVSIKGSLLKFVEREVSAYDLVDIGTTSDPSALRLDFSRAELPSKIRSLKFRPDARNAARTSLRPVAPTGGLGPAAIAQGEAAERLESLSRRMDRY